MFPYWGVLRPESLLGQAYRRNFLMRKYIELMQQVPRGIDPDDPEDSVANLTG